MSEVGKLSDKFDHAVERLTDKIDSNKTEFHGFRVEVTKQLSSLQTTAKVAGAVVTVLASIAIYFSRNAYQTAFAEGEKVGTLQAKMATIENLQARFDMMEKAILEHFKNPMQPTNYRIPGPDQKPETKDEHPPTDPLPPPPFVQYLLTFLRLSTRSSTRPKARCNLLLLQKRRWTARLRKSNRRADQVGQL